MVLIIMVGILVYRGYVIFNPPPEPPLPPYRNPIDDPSAVEGEQEPPRVQPRPPMNVPQTYSELQNRNPFRYNEGAGANSDDEEEEEDLGIELLSIREGGGEWRARIRSENRSGWYTEDEGTDAFDVLEINPEEETVVIMSNQHNRTFTLSPQ